MILNQFLTIQHQLSFFLHCSPQQPQCTFSLTQCKQQFNQNMNISSLECLTNPFLIKFIKIQLLFLSLLQQLRIFHLLLRSLFFLGQQHLMQLRLFLRRLKAYSLLVRILRWFLFLELGFLRVFSLLGSQWLLGNFFLGRLFSLLLVMGVLLPLGKLFSLLLSLGFQLWFLQRVLGFQFSLDFVAWFLVQLVWLPLRLGLFIQFVRQLEIFRQSFKRLRLDFF